jgi:hypothetical protein
MDERDVCSGCDDNEEAPIGCSVTNNALVNMGMVHQWTLFFQKGGWSECKDQTEMENNKYPWQREFYDFFIVFLTA